jgi:triphosphoribosyl-dephospho-CoA synthase
MLPLEQVAFAAEIACLLEVSAPKPGNVTRLADFADTRYVDFLIGAAIVGRVFRDARRVRVGSLVLETVRETQRLVGRNTNLGIALLFAPLARAALLERRAPLRSRVRAVLDSLTPADGRDVYEAIRLAEPGGLGEAERMDVRTTRRGVRLRDAMRMAMDRDSIAREYVTAFEITLTVAAPALERFITDSGDPEASIVQTFLTLLARAPDSLISRKCGVRVARRVSGRAAEILAAGGLFTQEGRWRLARFDRALRRDGNRLNPGTTADLTAAAIFALMLNRGIGCLMRAHPGARRAVTPSV